MKNRTVNPERVSAAKSGRSVKDEILRARCKTELKTLVHKAADVLGLDEADIIRIGAQRYAAEVIYRPPGHLSAA